MRSLFYYTTTLLLLVLAALLLTTGNTGLKTPEPYRTAISEVRVGQVDIIPAHTKQVYVGKSFITRKIPDMEETTLTLIGKEGAHSFVSWSRPAADAPFVLEPGQLLVACHFDDDRIPSEKSVIQVAKKAEDIHSNFCQSTSEKERVK